MVHVNMKQADCQLKKLLFRVQCQLVNFIARKEALQKCHLQMLILDF